MRCRTTYERKSYAMYRMGRAIGRAIVEPSSSCKERAAKWAAAWGMLCGIKTGTVNSRKT